MPVKARIVLAAGTAVVLVFLWFRVWPRESVDGPYGPAVTAGQIRLVDPESAVGPWPGDIEYGALTVRHLRDGVEARRAADGSPYWRYRRLAAPSLTWFTALDDRRVLVVWCDDRAAALDIPTGRVQWSVLLPPGPELAECEGGADDQTVHQWTVTVRGGVVEVSRAGHITRLDASTGERA